MLLPNLITSSLAPAVAISAAALMTLGLLNRLAHLGSRVRQLNQALREEGHSTAWVSNLRLQVTMVLKRARMVRNVLLLLYFSIACMVLTATTLALNTLGFLSPALNIPVWTFLIGLLAILIAVVQEMFEVLLALKALKLDIEANQHT